MLLTCQAVRVVAAVPEHLVLERSHELPHGPARALAAQLDVERREPAQAGAEHAGPLAAQLRRHVLADRAHDLLHQPQVLLQRLLVQGDLASRVLGQLVQNLTRSSVMPSLTELNVPALRTFEGENVQRSSPFHLKYLEL